MVQQNQTSLASSRSDQSCRLKDLLQFNRARLSIALRPCNAISSSVVAPVTLVMSIGGATRWLYLRPKNGARRDDDFSHQLREQVRLQLGQRLPDSASNADFLRLCTQLKRSRGSCSHREDGLIAKFGERYLGAVHLVFAMVDAPGEKWAPLSRWRLRARNDISRTHGREMSLTHERERLLEEARVRVMRLGAVATAEVLDGADDGSPDMQAALLHLIGLARKHGFNSQLAESWKMKESWMPPRAQERCKRHLARAKEEKKEIEAALKCRREAAKVLEKQGRGCEKMVGEIADFLYDITTIAGAMSCRHPVIDTLLRFIAAQQNRDDQATRKRKKYGLVDIAPHIQELLTCLCAPAPSLPTPG